MKYAFVDGDGLPFNELRDATLKVGDFERIMKKWRAEGARLRINKRYRWIATITDPGNRKAEVMKSLERFAGEFITSSGTMTEYEDIAVNVKAKLEALGATVEIEQYEVQIDENKPGHYNLVPCT